MTGNRSCWSDPSDAATIYDTPNATLNPNYHRTTLDGTGVNVGIVGDSNVDLTPVANYRQAFLGETAGSQGRSQSCPTGELSPRTQRCHGSTWHCDQ
jgi:phosphoglycolate phosphatase-like HAD superfamily hydrolase